MPKLLIVDDEKLMRDFGKPFFERRGYDVFYSATGKEGIELFKEISPDVVLLDLGLPDIDGKDVLAEMKQQGSKSKIVVLTGFGEEEIKEKIFSLEPDAYITKPCQFPVIAKKIEEIISE